jgi:hypothetical protein
MILARTLLLSLLCTAVLCGQVQYTIPNPVPNNGGNATPFTATTISYVLILPASALDPNNRRITDLAFLPGASGLWNAPDLLMVMGHVTSTPGPSSFFLPIVSQGVVQSSGIFSDAMVLFDSSLDGPFSYPWTAGQFSPLDLPQNGGRSFDWNGTDSVAVYLSWQNATTNGALGFFAAGDTTMTRYWRSAYRPTAPDQWASFGLITRVSAQPIDPTVNVLGQGCLGSTGVAPSLHTNAQLPAIGNLQFGLHLDQALPQMITYLYASLSAAETPLPLGGGCLLHIELNGLLALMAAGISPLGPTMTNTLGAAVWPLPLPTDPNIIGLRVAFQAIALDAVAPQGWAVTNGLDVFFN